MSRFHPALLAVVAAFAALAVQAQTTQGTAPPRSGAMAPSSQAPATRTPGAEDPRGGVSKAGREFMKQAAHAVHAEVEASQLALARAVDPGVKRFAQRMVDDHTQVNVKLQRIAQAKGVTLPSEPTIAQMAKLQLLKLAEGADFDQRYAGDFAIEAHRDSVELFDQAATQVEDPDLGRFVSETLPQLREHLQTAQSLRNEMANRAAEAPAPVESSGGVNASGTSAGPRTPSER